MIRRIFLIALFIFPVIAQTVEPAEEVDIQELVRQQIDEARKKEKSKIENENSAIAEPVVYQKAKPETEQTIIGSLNDIYNKVEDNLGSLEIKLIILSSFTVVVMSVVGVKRGKKKNVKVNNFPAQEFKKNIKLVREEKFIRHIDPKLKKLRTNLYLNTRYLNESSSDLSETARKLNIAKTELILASRFSKEQLARKFINSQSQNRRAVGVN